MIRLAKPEISEEDIFRAVEVLRSGMLVQGDNVLAFEQNLATFAKLPYAVVVSSGTAALHLALKGLGIGPGDTVIAPAFTFPATANVIEVVGAETALCDVDEKTFVVSPEAVVERIASLQGKKVKAVMVVHEFGYPARISEISEICRKHGLFLIEDAACALGTEADGKHPGFYSDIACFSFHPRKAITTGEGGAIMTRNLDIAEKIICLRNHGIMHSTGGINFQEAGLNYRLTEFQAALALGQIDRFGAELNRRRELTALYRQELKNIPGLTLPEIPAGHSLQSFMVLLDATFSRNNIIASLLDRGIQTNIGAQALNCLFYYRQKYNLNEDSFPVSTRLYNSGLLPLHGRLIDNDIQVVCKVLCQLLFSSKQP